MRLAWRLMAAAAFGGAIVSASLPASADEHEKKREAAEERREAREERERLPVSYTERPITLPRLILSPDLEFAIDKLDATNIRLDLSARFGITDDLEVYARFAPFEIGPFGEAAAGGAGFSYANPKIGASYRFIRGKFELGATFGVVVVTHETESLELPYSAVDEAGVALEPGVVAKLHLNERMSLEAAAYIPLEIGAKTGAGLRVPIAFAYSIIEPFHVGVRSGIGISNFAPPGSSIGSALYIPLGIFAGYAIRGKNGPILDIDPFFAWPALFTPGVATGPQLGSHGGSQVNGGLISAGISIGGFFYL